MVQLSQRDARWGNKPIGNTNLLIRDFGCTITCLSMLSDYFKCFQNPGWMAKYLQFTDAGKVYWNSIGKVLCFRFTWRFYEYEESRILDAIKNPRTACLLEIKKKHWVVAVRKVIGGYYVIDPWTGRGNIYATSSISGGATFIK